MARMKFLCDADRCINCNACVTACKNENEVPWGINRRRVVTINDGKPGERRYPWPACIARTRPAPPSARSVAYFRRKKAWCSFEGSVHRLRLLLLRLPVRRTAISARSAISVRAAKWINARYCAGGGGPEETGSVEEYAKYGANRLGARQAAAMRGNVLDEIVAGRGRRDHRADLQGASVEARLWVRRLGLDDGLSRVDPVVRCAARACGLGMQFALLGFLSVLAFATARPAAPAIRSERADRSAGERRERAGAAAARGRASKAASTCPTRERACSCSPPAGKWDHFHEVILHWLGAIVILGMIALLALAYLVMGRVRMSAGRSGKKLSASAALSAFHIG